MTNTERILEYLRKNAPNSFSNADLVNRTGVRPHPQVFQITQRLMAAGEIQGRLYGKDWMFWCDTPATMPKAEQSKVALPDQPKPIAPVQGDARAFEAVARLAMSRFFNVVLSEASPEGVPKRFDLVSEDGSIIGDAKYYSMVRGEAIPPAKFSIISEHVWLLEKCRARHRFLAFGNQRQVPVEWLSRYGGLLQGIDFYFISGDGSISKLN